MSIFRDTFQKDIKLSLENRQVAMTRRNTTDIQYLNSRNSWIRMCSSVDVNNDGGKLASQYVLQGGTLQSGSFALKSGIGTSANNAYSTITPSNTPHRLGIRPMPGITNVEVKSKSAYGSLREATVSFQCWDVRQLEDLELLYMRPGYTVLVEWGWTPYLDKNGSYQPTFTDFYSNNIINGTIKDRTKIFQDLYDKCTKYGGNYDAIFGYVKNYQWSAREDGGYDCQTTIISTGEVIESIKVNYVRGDLKSLKMYDTGSVGAGFLDELFSSQGNTKSTTFAEHYQKNVLAGIWAELNYKLKDPNAPLSTSGSQILSKKNVILDLPGLTNYGNFDTFIQPGSKLKTYITLEAAFDIINKYVLVKSSNDQEPLVKLTTKTETYSGNGAQDLLCVAHPVQISVDPTVCMIKNDLWINTIANTVSGAVAPTSAAITTLSDQIAEKLINSSIGDGVNMTDFIAAVRQINDPILYVAINQIFVNGKYNNTSKSYPSGWQYSNGFQGLLEDQFITNKSSLKGGVFGFFTPYTERKPGSIQILPFSDNMYALWWLYRIQKSLLPSLGITMSINLTGTSGVPNTTFDNVLAFPSNAGVTLDTTTFNPKELFKLKNSDSTSFSKEFGVVPFAEHGLNVYSVSGINITAPPTSTNTAVALTLNAGDATNIIKSLNTLDQQFFLNGDSKTELGIIGNIYVSLDFLYRQSLNTNLEASDTKEKNEINLYSYIKGIMSGIQVAIGNLNNFEVHVDPVDNKARAIDVNYTNEGKVDYNKLFKLEVQNLNSVVRNYTLQSQIFPNQSSIIAIGSQVKAGQSGIQNKTLTGFNTGLIDRIVGDKVDPFGNTYTEETLATGLAGIIVLYASLGVPIDPNTTDNVNIGEYISRAKNALRDLIVYFQQIYTSPGSNRNILPFKFSFEMDGVGGLIIGSLFKIDEEILPKGYQGKTAGVQLAQTVTTIAHSISNGDWTTKIDALNLILDRKDSTFDFSKLPSLIIQAAQIIINNGGIVGGGGNNNPAEVCYGASTDTVNTVYPRSVKFGGTGAVIVLPTSSPTVSINKNNLGVVAYKETIVTPAEYVAAAERVIEKLAAGASPANKKKILISAYAISRSEQGGPNGGFRGFNNNISGIEADGFKVFAATDVNGKVEATEGGTKLKKYYYSFSSLDAGLVPLISKIMERNMFATGNTAGEWAWRWYRDWNAFGARILPDYISDCTVVGSVITNYNFAANIVPGLTKYKG